MTATTRPPADNRHQPRRVNRPLRRSSFPLLDLYRTAVGKKWVMALTGIGLMGFVLAHMIGNLKLYQGQAPMDDYGAFLRVLGYPILPEHGALWIMRTGLVAMFVLHIHAAYSLTLMNRRARPERYSERDHLAVSFAARTMRWSGVIVLLFLGWHLADLTWGFANPDFVSGAVYDNVVASLSRVPVAILYVVANLALGLHLYHGSWSIFQSLGSMSPRFDPRRNPLRRGFALAFAVVVAGANITFPLAVQFGIIAEQSGGLT